MTTALTGQVWASSLTGERTELYGVDVLDATESPVLDSLGDPLVLPYDPGNGTGLRAGLTGGQLTYNQDSRIMMGCSLSLVDPINLIDWMSCRFRPWVNVNDVVWNLGIYLPANPDEEYEQDSIHVNVDLVDKTSMLDEDATDSILSIPAGASAVAWVEQMIVESTGESVTGIVPSDKTLRTAMTWPAGTSKLTVVNDLLGSIKYNNLWCDFEGMFRSEQWVDPARQLPSVVFAEGSDAIHSARFVVSQNRTGVPNKVICTTTGDDSNPGLVAVATNTDPDSPYSYSRRGGRWISRTYSDIEAADQETLDGIAARNLALNSTPPWYVSVSHAVVPLQPRQVLRFTSGGIDRQVVVNEWTISMTPGDLMTGKWLAANS